MSEHPVAAAVVIVPARDEDELLGACLASVTEASLAAVATGVTVQVVVVANRCTDATVRIARRHGVHVLVNDAVNVGRARADGCVLAGSLTGELDPAQVWLATTDADSVVPARWLVAQLEQARRGADAFVGTIALGDADAARHPGWWTDYQRATARTPHGHVHGASLGVRADAYLRAGGFPAVASGEDERLIAALVRHRASVAWVDDVPVTTSARHRGRAPFGVGRDLRISG
ncbi:MAG TPA: glycosyltransferase [Nocardioidaceae bacterium]|nr:glycosyltransferase [Nocardioidaceae bacterium]